ncbi:MAG: MFS transporter [Alphaproteobacteria bacterium CG_4_9_14_3_um_filter_47_13]|nr:MAG: MFS transporter [Alphaproteobacteria bacterium CG_4_9_14_3_um_filter_47_13]
MIAESGGVTKTDQVRALSLSTLAFTVCFAVWTIFSIIGIQIKEDLGLNDTQFGLLVATPILTGSLSRLLLGIWTDQYGGRVVFTLTMMTSAVATYLLSSVETYEMFLLAALGVGLAGGGFAVGIAYVSQWYGKAKQGTALGIFGVGNVGAAVTNFGAPYLLVALGWEQTAQIYAAIMFSAAILFFLLTKDDPKLTERKANKQKPRSILEQMEPLKNLQVWRFSLYYFFVFGAFVALALWLPRYYVGVYGLDIKTAGLLAAAFALPGSVFRALGGWMSDRYGARTIMYWTFSASVIVCFFLSYPATHYTVQGIEGPIEFTVSIGLWPFVGLTVILGFFMSLGKAAVYKHIPVYYPDHVGAVGGIVGLIGGLGGFFLPIVFGLMNDLIGVWTSCFMLLFGITVFALLWMHASILYMEGAIEKPLWLPEFKRDKSKNKDAFLAASKGVKFEHQGLVDWDPENEEQWNSYGKKIAYRNLWISIPCLLCAFAIWLYWGIITVQMLNLGFPFAKGDLFSLMAIAGLSGATLRIPSTFFIRLAGGRNTIFMTTALLILPAFGTGIALQDINTPLWVFQGLALLSGIGGGNFASSMSNISFFFPKRMKGLSLGLNAGLGNFGVTTMQILIPLIMTFGIFGGSSMVLQDYSGTLIGKIPAGTETYIQNAGFVWLILLIPLSIAAWLGMDNIRAKHVSPELGAPPMAFFQIGVMLTIGLITAAVGLWLILPESANGSGWNISKYIVLPGVIAATVFLLKMFPGETGRNLKHQYRIFKHPHTWVMTVLYTMTFGSFIGFAAAFPLAIKVIFGFQHIMGEDGIIMHDLSNPNGPSALMYGWMGAFIGALIRPVGGWIADRIGGALVTQICSVVMVVSALGVAYYMKAAYGSETPEIYFVPFLLLFLVLFTATGIGNGSTFRTVAMIFDKEQAGPVLGWTSAVAAYGAFIIPHVLGEQIKLTTPEVALYSFATFYGFCVLLNWWAYLRPGAKHKNP